VRSYLGESDPKNPLASPLYGDLKGLPPVRVHVGDDEVLLEDSRRYVERAVAAGADAKLDVWMGMPHVFVTGVGNMHAANQALRAIGAFLNDLLEGGASAISLPSINRRYFLVLVNHYDGYSFPTQNEESRDTRAGQRSTSGRLGTINGLVGSYASVAGNQVIQLVLESL
jgi:hypothetical protein